MVKVGNPKSLYLFLFLSFSSSVLPSGLFLARWERKRKWALNRCFLSFSYSFFSSPFFFSVCGKKCPSEVGLMQETRHLKNLRQDDSAGGEWKGREWEVIGSDVCGQTFLLSNVRTRTCITLTREEEGRDQGPCSLFLRPFCRVSNRNEYWDGGRWKRRRRWRRRRWRRRRRKRRKKGRKRRWVEARSGTFLQAWGLKPPLHIQGLAGGVTWPLVLISGRRQEEGGGDCSHGPFEIRFFSSFLAAASEGWSKKKERKRGVIGLRSVAMASLALALSLSNQMRMHAGEGWGGGETRKGINTTENKIPEGRSEKRKGERETRQAQIESPSHLSKEPGGRIILKVNHESAAWLLFFCSASKKEKVRGNGPKERRKCPPHASITPSRKVFFRTNIWRANLPSSFFKEHVKGRSGRRRVSLAATSMSCCTTISHHIDSDCLIRYYSICVLLNPRFSVAKQKKDCVSLWDAVLIARVYTLVPVGTYKNRVVVQCVMTHEAFWPAKNALQSRVSIINHGRRRRKRRRRPSSTT